MLEQTTIKRDQDYREHDLFISKSTPKISEQRNPIKHFVSKSYLTFDKNKFLDEEKISILVKCNIIFNSFNNTKYYFNPEIKEEEILEKKLKELKSKHLIINDDYIKHLLGVWKPPYFLSLAKAINEAKPGECIYIKPGIYKENITIRKQLEIFGQGNPGEVIIEAERGTVISFQADTGRLFNLSIQQGTIAKSKFQNDDLVLILIDKKILKNIENNPGRVHFDVSITNEGQLIEKLTQLRVKEIESILAIWQESQQSVSENCYGISIIKGRLELESCDISCQGLAGVYVYGSAHPYIKNNKIHDNAAFGVFFDDNTGCGELKFSDIYNNIRSGVIITKGGNPKLIDNKIHQGKQDGVLIGNMGEGILEGNEIYKNEHAGIAITKDGIAVLRNNIIHDNQTDGVFAGFNQTKGVSVRETDNGILENNEIWGNSHSGVAIVKGKLALYKNKIHDNTEDGVYIGINSQGKLEDNDIFENGHSGMAIVGNNSNSELFKNLIHNNKQSGIFISDNGIIDKSIFLDKDILNKLLKEKIIKNIDRHDDRLCFSDFVIRMKEDQITERLKLIEGIEIEPILAIWRQFHKSQAILQDNDIFENNEAGVTIWTIANPTIKNNLIRNNRIGVSISKNGLGILENNEILENDFNGVEIKTGGNIRLKDNLIHKNIIGVFIDNGSGILSENKIYENLKNGVEIKTGGNPTLCNNHIYKNKTGGVFVGDNGQGKLEKNKIYENTWAGVTIGTDGNPILTDNTINKNQGEGVYVCEGSNGLIERNDLRNNKVSKFISGSNKVIFNNNKEV